MRLTVIIFASLLNLAHTNNPCGNVAMEITPPANVPEVWNMAVTGRRFWGSDGQVYVIPSISLLESQPHIRQVVQAAFEKAATAARKSDQVEFFKKTVSDDLLVWLAELEGLAEPRDLYIQGDGKSPYTLLDGRVIYVRRETKNHPNFVSWISMRPGDM